MWRNSFSFTALAIACAHVAAQTAVQALPTVSVTATRTESDPFDVPASVTVIDGDSIRRAGRPEINISESLAIVPGVAARDRWNFAQDLQLSIRGFGSRSTFGVRGVRLHVDGIPATMPDGQGQLAHIDLASAGRVEVLRGPFSVLHGNSSGGVVQVTTDTGEGAPLVGASVTSGSHGLRHPGVRVSGSSGSVSYLASANRLEFDGWRQHSAVKRDVANVRLDLEPADDRRWTFVANAMDLRALDPLGLTRAQFEANPRGVDPAAITFNTRKAVRQDQLGAIHEARLAGGNSLRVLGYAGRRNTTQFQSIPLATQSPPLHPGGVIGLEREYAGTDLRWTHKQGRALEVVAGLAYETMREHRQGWQNFAGGTLGVQGALRRDEDNRVSSLDPYLQGVWRPDERWTVTAGVRRSSVRFDSRDRFIVGPNGDDSGSVRYSATLPALAAMFAVSPRLNAYAAFGRGFETPTFNELAYRPGGAPGLNFGLRPARSDNYELGLKGRTPTESPWRVQWNAALFETRTRDELVTQTSSGGRSTFQNAGTTKRRGLEIDVTTRLPSDWTVQFAQTWLDARYLEAFRTCAGTPCATPALVIPAGNRIPGTAKSSTAFAISWEPPQGWRAGAELRRSSRVWVNDANTDAAPSFSTLALHAGYVMEVDRWSLAALARVDNVTDRRYAGSVIVNEGNGRFYEPAPGRMATVKLTASYGF